MNAFLRNRSRALARCALLLATSIGLACHTSASGDDDPDTQGMTFGVVQVGPKNDHGSSQAHYEGAQYVQAKLPGSHLLLFESLNTTDHPESSVESVVDDMVRRGARLIFTTSDEFEEDTNTVARKYPGITFISVSGDDAWAQGHDAGKAPPNEGNLMGRVEHMVAIAGCAAALATETGKLGYVGPLINFETRRIAASAFLGAQYCYETIRGHGPASLRFTVTWIGFWFHIPGVTLDPRQVANGFFDAGADVVLSGIDTPEAIEVAGQRAADGEKVWATPYDFVDACSAAPTACLGVPFFNWGPAYLETAREVQNGTWQQSWKWSAPYWQDLSDRDRTHVGWVNGPALTAAWAATLDQFVDGLASGAIALRGPINLQDGTPYLEPGETATDQQIWYLPQLLEGMEGASQ